MPLDGKNGQAFVRERLDHAVVRAGKAAQAAAQPVDRLMVRAVDDEARAIERAQQPCLRADGMQTVTALAPAVSADMLMQCAAEEDVDELQAAADPEHGQAAAQKILGQGELARVTGLVDIRRAVKAPAVPARVKVAAAHEQEDVGLFGRSGGAHAGQGERIFVIFQGYRQINALHTGRICAEGEKIPCKTGKVMA